MHRGLNSPIIFTLLNSAEMAELKRYRDIGPILRKARKSKGITQKEVCERTGYSRPDYSRLEKGMINISLERLIDMCDVIGLTIEIK